MLIISPEFDKNYKVVLTQLKENYDFTRIRYSPNYNIKT
jgi:hypothetical protein